MRTVSCVQIALLVVSLYVVWTAAYLLTPGHNVRDFIHIGTNYIAQGHGRSRAIHLDPGYRPLRNQAPSAQGAGYDGQFYYYIALDPAHARYYLDVPTLRYGRIVYPLAARALALGQRGAIPWTLLLINLLAVGGGTWTLAVWLRRRGVSPLWALLYGLWPGMVVAVQRDLTEPVAYGLVVAGVLLLDRRGRWRLPVAGVAFGLAGLAREVTLVFPLVYALWLAFGGRLDISPPLPRHRRWRSVLAFLVPSLGPYVAALAYLYLWLGTWPTSNNGDLNLVPFYGLLHGPYRLTWQGVNLVFVVLPVVIASVALAPRGHAWSHRRWLPWTLMLVNLLANVVFYGRFYQGSYTAISRDAIGIVISGLMCVPYLDAAQSWRRTWLTGAVALGMVMLPVVAVYGFTNVSA